jgi:hypothetical protein
MSLSAHALGALERLACLGAALSVSACRTAIPSHTPPERTPSLSGTGRYEAVPGPSEDASRQVSQRLFIPAEPDDANDPPAYPERLLRLHLPAQRIVVRIALDEHGKVTTVETNVAASEADSQYRPAFEDAIRIAVASWHFKAATERTFVNSPDDGSGKPAYKVLKSETAVPTWFDIRFIFEVADGKGVLRLTH